MNADSRQVLLHAATHEHALTEARGQYSTACGCRWRGTYHHGPDAAEAEHAAHVRHARGWGRLTVVQRQVLDVLTRDDHAHQGWARACEPGRGRGPGGRVNLRAATVLVRKGLADCHYVAGRAMYTATEAGRELHPLADCSASRGGRPCGYCHACRRPLPTADSLACPACGSTDYDE